MSDQTLLDYEIILLLAKYGEKQVLSTLARNLHIPSDLLETKLTEMGQLTPRSTRRKRTEPSEIIESLLSQHPDKSGYLKTLLSRFQNKTFLPELKDVRRFFDRHSDVLGRVKSRAAASAKLFKLLASLDLKELANLCEDVGGAGYSSLGILSSEIMRREE